MLIRKTIAIIFILTGIVTFLAGIFYDRTTTPEPDLKRDQGGVERKIASSIGSPRSKETVWLFAGATFMIGAGSYTAGSIRKKTRAGTLTLDFSKK